MIVFEILLTGAWGRRNRQRETMNPGPGLSHVFTVIYAVIFLWHPALVGFIWYLNLLAIKSYPLD